MYTMFVARGYPTEKYKTYGIFEFDQAKALAQNGVKVVYAAIDLRSIRRWRRWGIYIRKIDGVEVYSINIPIGNIPKNSLRKIYIWALDRLYKKIEKEQGRPDIIHSHFTEPSYAASSLKEKLKIPFVVTEHSSKINKEIIDKDLFEAANIVYNKADKVITVSEVLRKRIKKNFNIDSIYIPNMVDLEIFKYRGKKQNHTFDFVSTGNLIEIKRMDLTIRAFYNVFKDVEDVSLKIFGRGSDREKLEALIKSLALESKVKLMGLCSREDIAKTLSESDCFVLASRSETFGVAYIEALAMGVPVIATRCGGPEGFVNEENGILVSVDDIDSLAEAMRYMYKNRDKFDAENIALETKKKFSSKTVADRIINVYKILNS